MERLQTVSHYVKWISSAPAVCHSAGKPAGPLTTERAGQCSAAEVGHVMAAASSAVPSAVPADRQPVIMHHTHGLAETLQITFFLLQRAGEWGQKRCHSPGRGRNGDRATRRHPVFVKHSARITAQALPGNEFRRHSMRHGMFHGDGRLGLLSPEGSLVFLSPHRDRVSQGAA